MMMGHGCSHTTLLFANRLLEAALKGHGFSRAAERLTGLKGHGFSRCGQLLAGSAGISWGAAVNPDLFESPSGAKAPHCEGLLRHDWSRALSNRTESWQSSRQLIRACANPITLRLPPPRWSCTVSASASARGSRQRHSRTRSNADAARWSGRSSRHSQRCRRASPLRARPHRQLRHMQIHRSTPWPGRAPGIAQYGAIFCASYTVPASAARMGSPAGARRSTPPWRSPVGL